MWKRSFGTSRDSEGKKVIVLRNESKKTSGQGETIDILTGEHDHFNYVHELLKKEAFFVKAFPW